MTRIVLASGSRTRIALLAAAGVSFKAQAAAIDERAVEAPLRAAGKSAAEIAVALAEAKALAVAGTLSAKGALTSSHPPRCKATKSCLEDAPPLPLGEGFPPSRSGASLGGKG